MLDVAIHNASCMLSDLYAAFENDENPDNQFLNRVITVEKDLQRLKKYTGTTPLWRMDSTLIDKYVNVNHYFR